MALIWLVSVGDVTVSVRIRKPSPFLLADPATRTYAWSRQGKDFPPGWPEQAPDLMARFKPSLTGIIHVPQVKRLKILIHGQEVETLAGHVDLTETFAVNADAGPSPATGPAAGKTGAFLVQPLTLSFSPVKLTGR